MEVYGLEPGLKFFIAVSYINQWSGFNRPKCVAQ